MDQSLETLVIINSVVLIIFLILGIIALVQLVLLFRHIRKLVQKAEDLAETVESVGAAFTRFAGPFSFGRFVGNLVNTMTRDTKKKGGK